MKVGTFIATLIMVGGLIFQIVVVSILLGGSATVTDFQTNVVPQIAYGFMYFTWILFFIALIGTKKAGNVIGVIFGFLGIAAQMIGIFNGGWISDGIFLIGGFIFALTSIFFFLGSIQYRKNNPLSILSSILLLLVMLTHNIFVAYIWPYVILGGQQYNMSMIIFLVGSMVQNATLILHGLILSFSKKKIYADDGAEDLLSVESGDAFASYVPSSKKQKKPKKKKAQTDDFSFDF